MILENHRRMLELTPRKLGALGPAHIRDFSYTKDVYLVCKIHQLSIDRISKFTYRHVCLSIKLLTERQWSADDPLMWTALFAKPTSQLNLGTPRSRFAPCVYTATP